MNSDDQTQDGIPADAPADVPGENVGVGNQPVDPTAGSTLDSEGGGGPTPEPPLDGGAEPTSEVPPPPPTPITDSGQTPGDEENPQS